LDRIKIKGESSKFSTFRKDFSVHESNLMIKLAMRALPIQIAISIIVNNSILMIFMILQTKLNQLLCDIQVLTFDLQIKHNSRISVKEDVSVSLSLTWDFEYKS
jgi:hypothetical protein